MEYWICPECLDKYNLTEKRAHSIGAGPFVPDQKMGICPMCKEYRILIKAEPLKESGIQKQEGLECTTH